MIGTHRYTVDEYAVSGGRWIRTLFGAGRQGTTMHRWDSIHYDRTGRRVLIGSNVHALTRLDDGQATTVGGRPLVAAW
ncbi:hypothetical protein ACFLIM_45520 [Nonomuraea sp. M3C6]|uniref:YD repeat-containing protein n=1 Tax=Nonomuraea marmarensis TaxID=3351344 RepID=A0ABW7ASR1_9ACTN